MTIHVLVHCPNWSMECLPHPNKVAQRVCHLYDPNLREEARKIREWVSNVRKRMATRERREGGAVCVGRLERESLFRFSLARERVNEWVWVCVREVVSREKGRSRDSRERGGRETVSSEREDERGRFEQKREAETLCERNEGNLVWKRESLMVMPVNAPFVGNLRPCSNGQTCTRLRSASP